MKQNESPRQRTDDERAADESKALKKALYHAARCVVLGGIAFRASKSVLLEQFGPKAMDDGSVSVEDIRAVAALIFIELSRSTDITKLPVKAPEPAAPKQPERQREEPRREEPAKREPINDYPDDPQDDIPF